MEALKAIGAWFAAGNPPHWVLFTLAFYMLGNQVLPQVPKLKANRAIELIFNVANKLLLPIFGRFPVLGPFLAMLDTPETKPAVAVPPALPPAPSLLLFVFLALGVASCASGTDGLRQACAAADTAITGGYQTTVTWYGADEAKIRATLTPATVATNAATFKAHQAIANKVLEALDAAVASKRAVCDLIPAIDAGAKADVKALIVEVVNVATAVASATNLIMGAL